MRCRQVLRIQSGAVFGLVWAWMPDEPPCPGSAISILLGGRHCRTECPSSILSQLRRPNLPVGPLCVQAAFDASAVELMRRLADDAGQPYHLHPMAMLSYDIMPPPRKVSAGESRQLTGML